MCRRDSEEGYTLVIVAGLIFVFLGFAALTVDVGIASSARTSAQRAADSAALAGAFTFVTNPNLTGTDLTNAITARATTTATQNNIVGDVVPSGNVTVTVDTANRRVTVNVTYSAH